MWNHLFVTILRYDNRVIIKLSMGKVRRMGKLLRLMIQQFVARKGVYQPKARARKNVQYYTNFPNY